MNIRRNRFLPICIFVLLIVSVLNVDAQSDPILDDTNIRLLHHIPNSEYIDINLSNDGRYLIALNSTYSGAGYNETDPNTPAEQYEATYLEIWELGELTTQNIPMNSVLPFENFMPPDFSKKIHVRQSGFSRPDRMSLSLASNNQIIAVGLEDEIRLYELDGLNLITTMYEDNRGTILEWSANGTDIAYLAGNNLVIWNIEANSKQEIELPADLTREEIYPVADGWIIILRHRDERTIIFCRDDVNECSTDVYDLTNRQLFPVMRSDGTIDIQNYSEANQIGNLDFTHLSNVAHSPSNRYIEDRWVRGIWDVQNQEYIQRFDRSKTIAWLSSESRFIGVDSPDVITTVSLYEIGADNPIQSFALSEALSEDWIFLTENLTNVTASMANSATVFVAPEDAFVVINLTWTLIYIPIIR